MPETPAKTETPLKSRKSKSSMRFSIRSMMILTTVMAAAATGAGHLWRAANGQDNEIAVFVMVTTMAPLGVMIAVSWMYQLFKFINK